MQMIPLDVPEVEIIVADPKIIVKGRWVWAADQLGIQPWGQILIIILFSEALLLFGWLWKIDGDVREVQGVMKEVPLAVSKDLLSQAKEDISAKKMARAEKATDAAEILLARSAAKRIPAKAEDFENLIIDLNVLNASSPTSALSDSVGNTRVVLANYRSALEPQPKMQGQQVTVNKTTMLNVEAATIDKSSLPGSVLVAVPGATFEFLGTPFIRRLANGPSVTDVGFMFGSQTLDGYHWVRSAFVNTLIHYDGGELELNNTRFINCTFQMPNNERSAKVAAYVALEQSYLKIGPGD
jgi:hypothetical protein